jgi:GT2 family glycosyltransferase
VVIALTPRAPLPTATLVIAADHRYQETRRCLHRISLYTAAELYDVVIVTDGHDQPTSELLAEIGGDVTVIRTEGLLSRTEALSIGAAQATGDVTVLMDNHAHPFRPWLDALLREFVNPRTVAAGCRTLNYTGTLRHTGFRMGKNIDDDLSVLTLFQGQPATLEFANIATALKGVGEGCLAVRTTALAAVGGLDTGFGERLFDVDLCLRLGSSDRSVIYQPQSSLLRGDRRPLPNPKPENDVDLARLQGKWQGRVAFDLIEGADGWSTADLTGTSR